jgi:hypothetical protein
VAILINTLFEERPRDFIAFTRQEMWITGLEALSRGLGLAIPDGGYAEGVYYARFILNYLAPLSVYFQKYGRKTVRTSQPGKDGKLGKCQ